MLSKDQNVHIIKLIKQLNNNKSFPRETILELIKHKTESTPILIKLIKARIDNLEYETTESSDYLYAFYILSQFKETQAHPYITKFAQLPANVLEKLYDQYECFIGEGFTKWLVSTYNGNPQHIKQIIENEAAYTWSRDAALNALATLAALNEIPRPEVIEYFRNLMHSNFIKDYEFATWLASAANDMYPEELYEDIKILFEKNLLDFDFFDLGFIDETLKMEKEKCIQEYALTKFNTPVVDVIKELAWMRDSLE